jgi:hypothetical protein
MKNVFGRFFVVELLAIVVAISSFSMISEKIVAGVIAGSVFSALGLWIFATGIWSEFRHEVRISGTFWLGTVHLFAIALPMMITRLLNHSQEFKDVLIWGLPGPVFHRLSTVIYSLLLAATAIDFVLANRRKDKKIA